MITLADAIQTLRPNIGFVMYDNDPKTIIWDKPEVSTPSAAEIEEAFAKLKSDEVFAIEAKAIAKAALLERLNITEDEVKLLLA